MENRTGVLFVCLGNICRSPTSEGVFRSLVKNRNLDSEIYADSVGTAGYHIGYPPDSRAVEAAAKRGVSISHLRARRLERRDFEKFDYMIGMDFNNLQDLKAMAPRDYKGRICLFMDFAPDWDIQEIPDPYYGGHNGFEQVLDMVQDASAGLIEEITSQRMNT